MEVGAFCLLRLRPNPRRIQYCILETLQKCSGYAIFQIAYGRLTSFFFGFSLAEVRNQTLCLFHKCLVLQLQPVFFRLPFACKFLRNTVCIHVVAVSLIVPYGVPDATPLS